MHISTTGRRNALFAFFFVPGVFIASWVTRTPDIRDALDASLSEMGTVLLGLSIGSFTGIICSGALVDRFGTKAVIAAGLTLTTVALMLMAWGVVTGSPSTITLSLVLFGLGMAGTDIAVNIDGAELEREIGKHILHAVHGSYSLGTVCGTVIGIGFNAVDFPVFWHLTLASILCAPVLMHYLRLIPGSVGMTSPRISGTIGSHRAILRDRRLMMIGLVVLAMALAEGSATDWLPILMVDEFKYSQTSGALAFLGFATAMAVGRFSGGLLLARFSQTAVVTGSAVAGGCGIAIVAFAHDPTLALVAVVLWGLGASLGFPIALSAAGDGGTASAFRVRVVAVAGYLAFLVGPPLLEFVGEEFGLKKAMVIVLALMAVAGLCAPSVRRPALVTGDGNRTPGQRASA